MLRGFMAVVAVLLATESCGPPPPVVRTAGLFGPSTGITMSPDDAALVDQYEASAPDRTTGFRLCHYWLDKEAEVPPERSTVLHYVAIQAQSSCDFVREHGVKLSTLQPTGDYAASLTLERSGDLFEWVDISLTRKGSPSRKTPVTIMTAPEFDGHKKHLSKVTDESGKTRISANEAKEGLFGDWFPGEKPGSHRMPEFILVVDDQRIPATEQIRPIYYAWIIQDKGQEQQRREATQAERDLEAVEADEAKTGRCELTRAAKMQNAAANIGRFFTDGMSGGSDSFSMIDKKIVVATKDGTAVSIDGMGGGDEHLYVIGFKPVRVELKDATGYPVQTTSPYAVVVQTASGGNVDSRNFHANMGEHLQAKVRGSGCALVLLVRKL